jgi:fucose 4-O-acetylase-like acetyltransferase
VSTFSLLAVVLTAYFTAYAVVVACRFTAIERHRIAVRTVGVAAGLLFGTAAAAQVLQGGHHYVAVRELWGIAFSSAAIAGYFCFQIVLHAAQGGRRHLPLERRDPDKDERGRRRERRDVVGA